MSTPTATPVALSAGLALRRVGAMVSAGALIAKRAVSGSWSLVCS
ncbi:hypothetical protein NBEOAGPD_5388 [Methylobacterium gregans]|uniref:Uncharacterized protein n=1 Tax=Methylobacterium gregans TaxID=374424 RepID=A0AA37MI47_9HYPH|nr:hypothetical protein NBEOAGPD_5388 [Methylobacterium gregans]